MRGVSDSENSHIQITIHVVLTLLTFSFIKCLLNDSLGVVLVIIAKKKIRKKKTLFMNNSITIKQ